MLKIHDDLKGAIWFLSIALIAMTGQAINLTLAHNAEAVRACLFIISLYLLILLRILRMSWIVERSQPQILPVGLKIHKKLCWLTYDDQAGTVEMPLIIGSRTLEKLQSWFAGGQVAAKLYIDPWFNQPVACLINERLFFNPSPVGGHSRLSAGKQPVTNILLITNCAVFLALLAVGDKLTWLAPDSLSLYAAGASTGACQEPWRLLTAFFLHGGIIHLTLNMFALNYLGGMAERLFGSRRFAALYFLSGVAGVLTSVATNPGAISVGASGALFGTASALITYGVLRREDLPSPVVCGLLKMVAFALLLNFPLFLLLGNVDHAAHLGGTIAGACLIVCTGTRSPMHYRLTAALCLMVGLPALFLLSAHRYQHEHFLSLGKALKNECHHQWKECISSYSDYLRFHTDDQDARLRRSNAYERLDDYQQAARDIAYLINTPHHPDQHYNHLAWLHDACGAYNAAAKEATLLINSHADSNVLDTRAVAFLGLKLYNRAAADLRAAIASNPDNGAAYFHLFQLARKQGRQEATVYRKKAQELKYQPDEWEWRI